MSAESLNRITKSIICLENLYSHPENLLEISVNNPITSGEGAMKFTDYEVIINVSENLFENLFTLLKTNLPMFKKKFSSTRKRYSEFLELRNSLIFENPSVKIPDISPMRFFHGKFDESTISERIESFQKFLRMYVFLTLCLL